MSAASSRRSTLRARRSWGWAVLVSSILTLSPLATAAQAERSFARLGSRDGLASDTVYAITQDRAGFIWLATGDGLNRYDGSRFVLFEHDPQGNDVIADSSISTMILDRQGRIWVGTWGGGADIIDPVSGAIENLRRDEAAREGIGDDRVQTLFEDASGAIWIGTFSGGLTRLDRPNGSMLRWHTGSPSRPLSNDRVWALAQSGDGAIWVGTGRGLDRLSGTDSVEHLEPFANDTIRALLTDRTGQLWIATERTIARIDPRSRALIRDAAASALEAALSVELVTQLFEDEGGAIWIGTQASGVFRFDPARGSVEHFEPDPARTGRLSHANVRSFFEDRSHVLWIGTRGGGVNRLDLKPAKFHALTNDPTDPRSLSPGAAAFIEDASGDIFVATDDGIDRFDRESHAITHLWQSDSPMRSVRDATSFFRDSRGTLWAGTWSTGLYRFDADQRVTRYEASGEPPLRLSSNRISEILEGRGGEIWVATAGGLDRIDPDRGVVMSYRNDPSDPRSLSENFVTTLFIDRAGTLWVGTDNAGLNHFDAASSTFSHFRRIPEVETSLSSDRIRMLHEDGDGILWIATGNGLNHLDPHTGTVRRYFAKDGLAHSRISSIVPDGEGMFWLGTPRGVTRFDPRNGKTRNYTIDDGLHASGVGGGFRDAHGIIYFGGSAGMTWFDPAVVRDNPRSPPVVLTRFWKGTSSAGPSLEIPKSAPIELSHEEDVFTFEFAALDFTPPERNRYTYMLEGLDRSWIDAGNRRSASYSAVRPGRYTFRVKAANADGVWNEEGASVELVITPPYWQTPWFRALVLLAVLALIYALHRMRIRGVEAARLQLEQEIRERTRDLRETNEQLQKMQAIVESINAETHFEKVLELILRITRALPSVDHAMALVHDPATGLYQVQAALGWELQEVSRIALSDEQVRTMYLEEAREVLEDVYLVERSDRSSRSMVIVEVREKERAEGFLIFENPAAGASVDPRDLRLLAKLKEPIASAFIKARMLDQLEQLNESKTEFIGIAAHDLRGPLGVIVGWVTIVMDQIERGVAARDAVLKHLALVKRSGETMVQLVSDLLDISSIESGKVEAQKTREQLVAILEGCIASHELVAEKKSIRLVLDEPAELPSVLVDQRMIKEVIDNLVSNAIKYTSPGGEVRVSCERFDGELVTHVRDTGQGLTEDDMKNVFRTFKRLSAKPTGGETSTGLGLAIVKKIVEVHGGRVWVESAEGVGSTFSFSLPVGQEVPVAQERM